MERAEPCTLCKKLGESAYVDYDEGEKYPEAVGELITVRRFYIGCDDIMEKCPHCNNYYLFHYKTDNDIIQPTHTSEYKRLSRNEAEELVKRDILYEKKAVVREKKARRDAISQYRRKLTKKGKIVKGLSDDEQKVYEYCIQKLGYGDWESLSKQVTLRAEVLKAMLNDFIKRGIVWANSSYLNEHSEIQWDAVKENLKFYLRD